MIYHKHCVVVDKHNPYKGSIRDRENPLYRQKVNKSQTSWVILKIQRKKCHIVIGQNKYYPYRRIQIMLHYFNNSTKLLRRNIFFQCMFFMSISTLICHLSTYQMTVLNFFTFLGCIGKNRLMRII